MLIISVVGSLPLVAFVSAVLPGPQRPSELGYVVLLLGLGLIIGYLAAIVRGRRRIKDFLGLLGYRAEPESSMYAQMLEHMSPEATVFVEPKDGRQLSGCPRNGPQYKDDGIIVPLSQVNYIVLSEEPTGAPPR